MSIPQHIKDLANQVRNEIYGKDVRESIAKSMEATAEVAEWSRQVAQDIVDGKFDEGELATEIERKLNELEVQYAPKLTTIQNEVENARGNDTSLGSRLNSISQDLAQTEDNINRRGVHVLHPPAPLVAAVGDGTTDDTSAIQAVIDYVASYGGGTVILGSHKVSGTLELYSDITVEGESDSATLDIGDRGGFLFTARGTVESEIPLATNLTNNGEVYVNTIDAHGYHPGDLILLKSQRDSLSDDAGELWRLGYATPASPGCYFGEFLRVGESTSSDSFKVTSGVIYPEYRTDDTEESSPTARPSSTVQKVNPVKNVKIRNLIIRGAASRVITIYYGYNCTVENIVMEMVNDGNFISFQDSFSCVARNCRITYDVTVPYAEHHSRNPYKTISSQACGFVSCYGENATQTFDLTYASQGIPSTFCYIKSCETKGAQYTGLTTHGGTYACKIIDNDLNDNLKDGMSIRTRKSHIVNNRVNGSMDAYGINTYGIALYEGWAVDCIVEGNVVSNFTFGLQVLDSVDPGEQFRWIGAKIRNNVFTGMNTGVRLRRNSENKYLYDTGVELNGNTYRDFRGTSGKAITVENYIIGVKITGELIDGTEDIINGVPVRSTATNGGIYFASNTDRGVISDIYITNFNGTPLWIEDPTDTASFPNNVRFLIGNIRTSNSSTNSFTIGSKVSADNHVFTGGLHPRESNQALGWSGARWNVSASNVNVSNMVRPEEDGGANLGWSGARFGTVYATTGTINTSDERDKQQIMEIPESWLDAWESVRFKTFKFNDAVEEKGANARWHIGIIAQSIYEAFSEKGLNAFDIGLLCYDEWIDEETGEKYDRWGIRPDECQFLEMALIRRELEKLKS